MEYGVDVFYFPATKYIYFSIKKMAVKHSFIIMLKLLRRIYIHIHTFAIEKRVTFFSGITAHIQCDTSTQQHNVYIF